MAEKKIFALFSACVFFLTTALLPLGIHAACDESALVPLVTGCAKEDAAFLQCVAADSTPNTQCKCLRASAGMRVCVKDCYAAVELALCGKNEPTQPTYKPASSSFLQYQGTTQPLLGIDGIYVVNLKRRSDRLARFFANTTLQPSDVHVLDAFDGQQLEWSDGLRSLFNHNTFNDRRTFFGQALSHFVLWRHIATTTNQLHLIFEDDQTLPPGFIELWNTRYAWSLPLDADIVYLGGLHPANASAHASILKPVTRAFATHHPNTLFSQEFTEGIDNAPNSPTAAHTPDTPTPSFLYATHAYILSSSAAKALELLIATHGFRKPVAHMLMKLHRTHKVYACMPLLAATVPVTTRPDKIDSDVQYDFTRVPEPGVPAELSLALPPNPAMLPLPHINTLGYGLLLPTFVIVSSEGAAVSDALNASAKEAGVRLTPFARVQAKDVDMDRLQEGGMVGGGGSMEEVGEALTHALLLESLAAGSFDAALILDEHAHIHTPSPSSPSPPSPSLSLHTHLLASLNTTLPMLPSGWHLFALDCDLSCGVEGQGEEGQQFYLAQQGCLIGLHGYVVSLQGASVLLDTLLPGTKADADADVLQGNTGFKARMAAHVRGEVVVACARPPLLERRPTRSAQEGGQAREEL